MLHIVISYCAIAQGKAHGIEVKNAKSQIKCNCQLACVLGSHLAHQKPAEKASYLSKYFMLEYPIAQSVKARRTPGLPKFRVKSQSTLVSVVSGLPEFNLVYQN